MKKIFKIILTSLLLIFSSYENTSFAVKNIKSNLFNKNDVDYQQQIASAHKKNKNRSGKKKKFKKNAKTWIKYKYPYLETNCEECKKLDGFIQPNKIDLEIYNMMGVMPGRKLTRKSFKIQKKRGVIKTGLKPKFYNNAKCVTCDDCWAVDYSHKREGQALHKGRDLPMPFNEPVLAIAAGTVIGIFENKGKRKGIEIVLRHLPEQSGLPFYSYTQYTHFNEIPDLKIGQKIKLGETIGLNGNSGKMGNWVRRPALHFAAIYSKSPEWSSFRKGFLVKDGYWMDPVAFLKTSKPYDNFKVKKLKRKQKKILVGYKKKDGTIVPENTKKIWPFVCN